MTGSGNDQNKRLPMLWSTTELLAFHIIPGATQSISDLDGVDVQMEDKNSC